LGIWKLLGLTQEDPLVETEEDGDWLTTLLGLEAAKAGLKSFIELATGWRLLVVWIVFWYWDW